MDEIALMQLSTMLNVLSLLAEGLVNTLIVTFTCFTSALIIGVIVAVLRRLDFAPLTALMNALVYIFRSIPVLIAVFLVYFGLPSTGLTISPLLALNISIGLISGSYLAEVFRGALQLVERSEIAAAQTSGMSKFQIIKYIELPQMFRFAIPGILNEFSSVLKASPFAYTVGMPEMTKQAMNLTAVTMSGLEIYTLAGILYFIIYKLSASVTRMIENKLHMTDEELKDIKVKTYGAGRTE